MIAKKRQNENAYANLAFSDTLKNPKWTEFPRTSIEISNKTLASGEFGTKVVKGNLTHSVGQNNRACSVKLLNGNANCHYCKGTKEFSVNFGSHFGNSLKLVV